MDKMNEEAVLIALDMIKKKIDSGAGPIAKEIIEDLESKLNKSLQRNKVVYQIPPLQPMADIEELRIRVNELINERNHNFRK